MLIARNILGYGGCPRNPSLRLSVSAGEKNSSSRGGAEGRYIAHSIINFSSPVHNPVSKKV